MPDAIEVRGINLDPQTRCAHYHSALDIVAIRMKCCKIYFACKDCHNEIADHPIQRWSLAEWDERAILCGSCRLEQAIRSYVESGSSCAGCGAPFNPGCRRHHHFYFETTSGA